MKSPERHNSDGFTILELVIVIGIFSVLVLIATPSLFNFYSRANASSEQSSVVSYLRLAQSWSLSNRDNNNHGIKISEEEYTLFTGASYALRDTSLDETYDIPEEITLSGATEIVFDRKSGRTTQSTINIISDIASRSIDINSEGLISW